MKTEKQSNGHELMKNSIVTKQTNIENKYVEKPALITLTKNYWSKVCRHIVSMAEVHFG